MLLITNLGHSRSVRRSNVSASIQVMTSCEEWSYF